MFINNLKAYVIIHELERNLRGLIARVLENELGAGWWEFVPPDIAERATQRRQLDRLEIGTSVESREEIDYTDLFDLWTIMRDRDLRDFFTGTIGSSFKEIEDCITTIKTYRDTIMHNRVLTTAGLEQLASAVERLATYVPDAGASLTSELARIDRDKFYQKVRLKDFQSALHLNHSGNDLNNLPAPDFDDFIGRRRPLDDLCKRLRSRYFPIVSIDGVGGVGKSALAYAAAERLWHAPDRPFAALVYLSAKATRLTHKGIETLLPTLTTYESLLDAILRVTRQESALDFVSERKEEVVKELLAAQPVLLILDNLETVTDDRIFEFIREWDYPGKVLITSRKRLGELERVIHLQEMQDSEAIALVRSVARGLGLTAVVERSNERLLPIVIRAGHIPLAIKWVLGQVALGKSIPEVTQDVVASGSPLLEFCFSEVVGALGDNARSILLCMPIFEESPSQGALVAASGLDIESFESGIQELILASLISPEIRFPESSGDPETVYSALPLTLAFAARALERQPAIEQEATHRLKEFQRMLSLEQQATTSLKYSLLNIGATTDLGRIAAFQALAASQTHRTGDPESARRQFKQAHETDPSVHGVLLLWADMEESEGNRRDADQLMRQASTLAPDDANLWFQWGLRRKNSQHLAASEKYLRRAIELDPTFFWSRFHLATILSWNGQYQDALNELDECEKLKEVEADTTYYRPILWAGRAECLRRWGDSFIRRQPPDVATGLPKLLDALRLAREVLSQDSGDYRVQMLYREVNESLGTAYYYDRDFESARRHLEEALFRRPVSKKEAWRNAEVHYRYARLEQAEGNMDEARNHVKLGLRYARERVRDRLLKLRKELETADISG